MSYLMESETAKLSYPKEKIKVVLFEGIHQNAVDTFINAGYTNIELLDRALPEEELIEKLQDVRIIGIRSKTQINRRVLESVNKLQAIGCFCIGTNQVDLTAATERGVAVFNSPYNNTRSVAELVIAEVVFLMRGIAEKSAAAHKGTWLKVARGNFEVRGKTLGIIGYGHIGSQVSVLAEAMGMKVIYYDIVPKLPMGNAKSVDSLDELLAESDVVTLHVPATPQTRYMIKAKELFKMKPKSALINLSRGNVVDIEALKNALEGGHLRGAAIDVFPLEPKRKGDLFTSPLQGMDNVILSPHIGGSTEEAQANIGIDAAQKLINYFDTGSTVGCHTIPELHLPRQQDTHRILHIRERTPGMLSMINTAISKSNLDIVGEYLSTNDYIGYSATDVKGDFPESLKEELKNLPNTIRSRVLH